MDDNDNDIVFDRDTSAPKKKLKDKNKQKRKSPEENENNNNNNIILSKNLINSENKDDLNKNKNKNSLNNKNKIKTDNSNSLPQSTDTLNIIGNNNKDVIIQKDINLNSAQEIKSFNDYDKFLIEYNEAMKSKDKDKILIVLKKRIEYMELNINDLNLLIDHLRQDIHNKENVIHILTETNTKLRQSLNSFSKKLDDQILLSSRESKPKGDKISKSLNKDSSKKITRLKLSRNENGLTNALTMNRILQKDNDNLKNLINNYGSVDKMKELENMNKLFKDENTNLNDEIFKLKKEIVDHTYCEKKRNKLLEQVKYLTEENKRLKKDLKQFIASNNNNNNSNNNNINTNNDTIENNNANTNHKYVINPTSSNLNIKSIILKNQNKSIIKKDAHFPNIIKLKNKLNQEKDKNDKNKNNDNKNYDIEHLTDKNEINLLIQLFEGDEEKYAEFKKKLIIYAKSKESIINKYKVEEKNYNRQLLSYQEQNEYLNQKVTENERKIKIYQKQLNNSNFQNKKLKKKFNEEIKEKENIILRLDNSKKKSEKLALTQRNNNKKDEKEGNEEKEEYEYEEHEEEIDNDI